MINFLNIKILSDVDYILKSLLNLLQHYFCCLGSDFWPWGIELAPQPGIKTIPLALESEVVTTGPLRKSLNILLTRTSKRQNFCSKRDILWVELVKS